MSVYTVIDESEIKQFLEQYAIGKLISHQGISEGIENTNYFVNTTHNNYVLTVFEKQSAEELPYFLDLMTHLSNARLPVPTPILDKTGKYLQTLYGKPATLISRLDGRTISMVSISCCRQIGTMLASIHLATENFSQTRDNRRDLNWCLDYSQKLLPLLPEDDAKLLTAEIDHHQTQASNNLPQGVIHADLFRDNALFNEDVLTGIIDFYYACNGTYLYDLAIATNDWCVDEKGLLDPARYQALVNAYRQKRPFIPEESLYWQNALRHAALRFWISRLYDKYFPRVGSVTHIKDPDFFKRILRARITSVPPLC